MASTDDSIASRVKKRKRVHIVEDEQPELPVAGEGEPAPKRATSPLPPLPPLPLRPIPPPPLVIIVEDEPPVATIPAREAREINLAIATSLIEQDCVTSDDEACCFVCLDRAKRMRYASCQCHNTGLCATCSASILQKSITSTAVASLWCRVCNTQSDAIALLPVVSRTPQI